MLRRRGRGLMLLALLLPLLLLLLEHARLAELAVGPVVAALLQVVRAKL